MNDLNYPQLRLVKEQLHILQIASATLGYKCTPSEIPPPESGNLGYKFTNEDGGKISVEVEGRFAVTYLEDKGISDRDKVELVTEKLRAVMASGQRPILIY